MSLKSKPPETQIYANDDMQVADSAYGSLPADDERSATNLATDTAVPIVLTNATSASTEQNDTGAQAKYNYDQRAIARSLQQAHQVALALKERATHPGWPMQVPLTENVKTQRPAHLRTATARPELMQSEERPGMRRAATTLDLEDVSEQESLEAIKEDPSLMPDNLYGRLQVLRPEVKMDVHGEDIISAMNPKAVGEIMEKQLIKTLRHLEKLSMRVDDTASKVLVTGDLNAGKSTLCNALLRQTVLPIDQQPCTEVFCEVLDAIDNENKEQVHAVSHGVPYCRENPETFTLLDLGQLESAVLQPEDYASLKVYVDDKRSLQTSLLRNGVVDISLIDAPGLNADSLQTTAVLARQEEIDVVVFVVSAENHFTLSAKEFLWNAANEKAFLFIVVNRFDQIRDTDRCRRQILEQVSRLSPQTFKHAGELVHFVSAKHASDEDVSFTRLEQQLRNFVLNKRAQSKLLPAQHFAGKFWQEARQICQHNIDAALNEQQALKASLTQVDGKLASLTRERQQAVDDAVRQNEALCEQVRLQTRSQIDAATETLAGIVPDVPYAGLLDAVRFAGHLRDTYLEAILSATVASELQTRHVTSQGVEQIRALGLAHLDPSLYALKPFHVDRMFSRKRDAVHRSLPISLSPLDFVDLQQVEALVGTSSVSAALVLVGGQTLGWSGLVDSGLRILRVAGVERSPKMLGAAVLVALAGLGCYVAVRVPQALTKNLASKVTKQVQAREYAQTNALRISSECRKVLSIPEQELRQAFASVVEGEQRTKSALMERLHEADATSLFYKEQVGVLGREQKKLEMIVL